MIRKILSLSLVAVMLSVTALAAPGAVTLNAVYAADEDYAFTAPGSAITAVTEKATVGEDVILNATHNAVLPEAWDGVVATEIDTDADGTYLISNGGELAYFATVVAGNASANAKLDADINLNNKGFNAYAVGGNVTATTVGNYSGVFDGQGHTIYNLSFENSQKKYSMGLFKKVNGGTVKNLNLVGATAVMSTGASSASHPQSLLCATLAGGGTLENIYVEGAISRFYNSTTYGRVHVFGAVCGTGYDGTIKNCISNVDIDFSTQPTTVVDLNRQSANVWAYNKTVGIGGILGRGFHESLTTGTQVINCGNMGNITAPKHRNVGGVVGAMPSNAVHRIQNCWNTGDITGYGYVGGVVGYSKRGSTAYRAQNGNLYNTGDVIAVAEHNDADILAGRTNDNPYAAGLGAGLQLTTDGYSSYSVGRVYTKTAEDTDEDGVEGDDDLGKDAYDANAQALTPDTVALLVSADSTSITPDIRHGLFYLAQGEQAPLWWRKTVTVTEGEGEEATTTTQTILANVYTSATALTEDQFKSQEAIDALNSETYANYVMDTLGLNGGYPIFQSQLDNLVTGENQFQIGAYNTTELVEEVETTVAHNYELGVTLAEAGYVSLDVKPFGADEVVIKAFDAEGNELDAATVTKAGIVTLATGENTDVVIKATAGRALINLDLDGEQVGGAAIAELDGTIIKVTLQHAEAATVVVALFAADDTLKAVKYAPATASVDGEVSAVINLNGVDTEGCVLRAYVWADGTLVPTGAEAALD